MVWGRMAVAIVRDRRRRTAPLRLPGRGHHRGPPGPGAARRGRAVRPADRAGQPGASPPTGSARPSPGNRRAGRSLALLCCGIDGAQAGQRLARPRRRRRADRRRWVPGSSRSWGVVDRVGRGDGDEFFVVAEGIDAGVVPGRADRVASSRPSSAPVEVQGHELRPAVSIGVALEDDADSTPAAHLLHDATTALYEAKGRGAGGVGACSTARIRARAVQRLTIETELGAGHGQRRARAALPADRGPRHPALPVAYEALARWRHPGHGLMLPGPVHPGGRGDGADRRARRARARPGVRVPRDATPTPVSRCS